MTGYQILKLTQTNPTNGLGSWEEQGEIEADNAARAEKKAVEQYGEGTYAAVPARSWNPTTYSTETKTRVIRTPYSNGLEVPIEA